MSHLQFNLQGTSKKKKRVESPFECQTKLFLLCFLNQLDCKCECLISTLRWSLDPCVKGLELIVFCLDLSVVFGSSASRNTKAFCKYGSLVFVS